MTAGLYNPLTNLFQYNWKTLSGWKGSCRVMTLELAIGQKKHASFQFQ